MYSKYLLTLRYLGRIHKKGYEEIELESLEEKKTFAHNYDGMCDENAVKCFTRKASGKERWKETNKESLILLSFLFSMATHSQAYFVRVQQ